MKKTFFYLFSVLCFMAMVFTSCERPDDKPEVNEYPVPAGIKFANSWGNS